MNDMKTTMKVCMNVECAGKEQPHSFDHGVGQLDCDGPCSERRVRAYRASVTAENIEQTPIQVPAPAPETDGWTPRHTGRYNMCGREVLLIPLSHCRDRTTIECFDCGHTAHTVVIERPDGKEIAKDAWTWCGVCEIGG